jgi:glucuronate isomerase
MRWCGVDERFITGDADDYDKFVAYASSLPFAPGNPLYHWSHLELQRYFDCDLPISSKTADDIWQLCNDKLRSGFSVRQIIRESNVKVICTTDDPTDDLAAHIAIAQDESFKTKVFPTFRPDRALAINKSDYSEYIQELSDICEIPILSCDDLLCALTSRLDFFVDNGCRLSDHGLASAPLYRESVDYESIFKSALLGDCLTQNDIEAFQSAMLLFLGKEYAKRDIVMQIHYGVNRNVNPVAFKSLGPDTGFDIINNHADSSGLHAFLGALEKNGLLPKTILYSLNPNDNAALACVAGAFQKAGVFGKVQHGSAWWFNDTKNGIISQLSSLAEMGALGGFVGMLTDSRSFLSYTRHEYFRRILCGLLGGWIDNGEYVGDMEFVGKLIEDISYGNAVKYFGFR